MSALISYSKFYFYNDKCNFFKNVTDFNIILPLDAGANETDFSSGNLVQTIPTLYETWNLTISFYLHALSSPESGQQDNEILRLTTQTLNSGSDNSKDWASKLADAGRRIPLIQVQKDRKLKVHMDLASKPNRAHANRNTLVQVRSLLVFFSMIALDHILSFSC